jgi:hypothetical protein
MVREDFCSVIGGAKGLRNMLHHRRMNGVKDRHVLQVFTLALDLYKMLGLTAEGNHLNKKLEDFVELIAKRKSDSRRRGTGRGEKKEKEEETKENEIGNRKRKARENELEEGERKRRKSRNGGGGREGEGGEEEN